jgi:hypothetical protein
LPGVFSGEPSLFYVGLILGVGAGKAYAKKKADLENLKIKEQLEKRKSEEDKKRRDSIKQNRKVLLEILEQPRKAFDNFTESRLWET